MTANDWRFDPTSPRFHEARHEVVAKSLRMLKRRRDRILGRLSTRATRDAARSRNPGRSRHRTVTPINVEEYERLLVALTETEQNIAASVANINKVRECMGLPPHSYPCPRYRRLIDPWSPLGPASESELLDGPEQLPLSQPRSHSVRRATHRSSG